MPSAKWKQIKAEDFNKLRLQCLSGSYTREEMQFLLTENCNFIKHVSLVPTLVEYGIIRKEGHRYFFKDRPTMLPLLQNAMQAVTKRVSKKKNNKKKENNLSDEFLIEELKKRGYVVLKQM